MRTVLLVVALTATGCSSGPQFGTIFGSVTLDGKPVTAGFVTFIGKTGGTPVTGPIGENGTYRVEGVPVGEVLVGIVGGGGDEVAQGEIMKRGGASPSQGPPPKPKPKVVLPANYAEPGASGFVVKVKPMSEGEVQFDIPLKK